MNKAYRKANIADALYIANRLRASDKDELYAIGYEEPAAALLDAMNKSKDAIIFYHVDEPVIITGINPGPEPNIGFIWMVATDKIDKVAIQFALSAKKDVLPRWLRVFPYLINFVDKRNTVSITMIDKLGAKFYPETTLGPQRVPFLPFEFRRG